MIRKIVLLLVLFLPVCTAWSQDSVVSNNEVDAILEQLPAESLVLEQLAALDSQSSDISGNRLLETKRVYYSHLLRLIDEVKDYKLYKYGVLQEEVAVDRQIDSYNPEEELRFISLDELQARLVAFKTADNLYNEKKVVHMKLEYNRSLYKETTLSEQVEILAIEKEIGSLQNRSRTMDNSEALKASKEKISMLQDVIAVKRDYIEVLEAHIALKDLKVPLAKRAIDTFKKKRKHERVLVTAAKKRLSIDLDELDSRRLDLRGQKKDMIESVEKLNAQIVSELRVLQQLRSDREVLLNKMNGTSDSLEKQNVRYLYDLAGYEINYHLAAVDFAELQKLYQQLVFQAGELEFLYLELYALESMGDLSLKKLNMKQDGVYKLQEQLSQIKNMAAMDEKSLKASIDTMQEMQQDARINRDQYSTREGERYLAGKIESLENEISLKYEYIDYLKLFQSSISVNESIFADITDFMDTRIGVRQLFIIEKKVFSLLDLFVLLSLILFIGIFLVLKKFILSHLVTSWTRKLTNIVLIGFPVLTVLLFLASLVGLDVLYRYVYFSTLMTLSAVYLTIIIVGRLSGARQRIEDIKKKQAELDSEITVKISLIAIIFATLARYVVYLLLIVGIFFIWTRQFNVVGKMIQFFDLDPVYVASIIMQKGLKLSIIIVIGVLVVSLSRFIGKKIFSLIEDDNHLETNEKEQRAKTLITVSTNLIKLVVITFVIFSFLQEIGVNIATLLTGAGIIGLAIGFGSQSLVKDFVSGFFVLMESQYSVGDVVKIGDSAGLVERITLRTTTLRNLEGMVHVIPNGQITTVVNMTHNWARAVIEVGVNYASNIDEVIEELKKLGKEFYDDENWQPLLLSEPSVAGVTSLADSAVMVRIMVDTKPIKQWDVGRELNRRIKNRFDEVGIEIAYPHVNVVYEDKYKDKK
jgi:small-conductance mechanosensitive channel